MFSFILSSVILYILIQGLPHKKRHMRDYQRQQPLVCRFPRQIGMICGNLICFIWDYEHQFQPNKLYHSAAQSICRDHWQILGCSAPASSNIIKESESWVRLVDGRQQIVSGERGLLDINMLSITLNLLGITQSGLCGPHPSPSPPPSY